MNFSPATLPSFFITGKETAPGTALAGEQRVREAMPLSFEVLLLSIRRAARVPLLETSFGTL
jgi:hypothetical protein